MLHLFLFFFVFLPSESYVLDETKDLQTICRGPQGITCSCRLTLLPLETEEVIIVISSCFRRGGWSDWTSWSGCSAGIQKRRRACTRPTPEEIPHVREEESSPDSVRRQFLNISGVDGRLGQSGVNATVDSRQEYGPANVLVVLARVATTKLSLAVDLAPKFEGILPGPDGYLQEYRFQAVAFSQGDLTLFSEVVEESRPRPEDIAWTEWEIRRGVALRYMNSTLCNVETKLLTLSVDYSRIPVVWVVYSSSVSMVIGFLTQCLLSACCRPARKRPKRLKVRLP